MGVKILVILVNIALKTRTYILFIFLFS